GSSARGVSTRVAFRTWSGAGFLRVAQKGAGVVTIEVTLDVFLKGVDLIASTAFLTLRDKMGYGHSLLGLRRLESYAFTIESPNPDKTVAKLRRVLSTQSTFYNRNKHNHVLRCRWDGGELDDGVDPVECRARLETQARATLEAAGAMAEDFDSQQGTNRVILEAVPVYRTEVLVEGLDPTAKKAMAQKLEAELETAPVVVTTLGTCWYLALRAQSDAQAQTVTEEITVTEKRDRGLLLNPNYEGYQFLATERINVAG
ncbi:MAG: hypothetical protein JSW50_08680, partial [Candidatus Latescibacterota bacterium]